MLWCYLCTSFVMLFQKIHTFRYAYRSMWSEMAWCLGFAIKHFGRDKCTNKKKRNINATLQNRHWICWIWLRGIRGLIVFYVSVCLCVWVCVWLPSLHLRGPLSVGRQWQHQPWQPFRCSHAFHFFTPGISYFPGIQMANVIAFKYFWGFCSRRDFR